MKGDWVSQMALMVKSLPANAGEGEMLVRSLGQDDERGAH